MGMEISHLRAFLAVAEELHFGRAAERLHMAQPPLSRIIKQLERDLGSPLFDRTTRSVSLTSAGRALLGPAQDVVEGCQLARGAVRAAGQGESGLVRLGFAGPSSHVLVGSLSRLVRQQHPGIELRLQSSAYAYEALRLVLEGGLDLALVRWTRQPPEIAYRTVLVERHVLAVPHDHRFADRASVRMEDCRDEAFVSLPADPGSSVRDNFLKAAHEAGFTPNIVQVAPDSWTAMALVAAGVGVSFAFDSVTSNVSLKGLTHSPVIEGLEPSYLRLAWRKDSTDPALREVLRAAEQALPTPEDAPAEQARG